MNSDKIVEKKIPVRGVNCVKCRLDIENILSRVKGVSEVKMDYLNGVISVKYDYTQVDLPELEKLIENLGYNVTYKEYEGWLTKLKRLFRKQKTLRKIDDYTFSGLVLETSKPVILLVYKGTCSECESLEFILTSLAVDFKDKIYFYKADCSLSNICNRYNIKQTPTILFIRNGVLKNSISHPATEGEIKKACVMLLESI